MLHCRLHRNEPRCLFKCIAAGCKHSFNRYGAFKAHFYRKHNVPATAGVAVNTNVNVTAFKCVVALCTQQCSDGRALIAHLKDHIMEGHAVNCPVTGCRNVF